MGTVGLSLNGDVFIRGPFGLQFRLCKGGNCIRSQKTGSINLSILTLLDLTHLIDRYIQGWNFLYNGGFIQDFLLYIQYRQCQEIFDFRFSHKATSSASITGNPKIRQI